MNGDDTIRALLRTSLKICAAGSAGISLLETSADGTSSFRWAAVVGAFEGAVGRRMQRETSPSGWCVDFEAPQHFRHPERVFSSVADLPVAEVLLVPLRTPDGRVIGTLWITTPSEDRQFDSSEVRILTHLADFTAFLLAHPPMRHEGDEGVHTVERSCAELAEACERLRAADRRKDEFLAMLGHEIRNPLGAIASAAVLLDASCEEVARCSHLLDIVKRQTRVITQLLDDLLDVSRMTLGKIDLKRCHVDLGDAVHQVADSLAKEANARQHVLEVRTSGDLQAFVDPMRLEQIVTNLLTNAIKYTDRGGYIVVSVRREGDVVVISVRDNGPGIDDGFLPYVFDLFSQAGATYDRAHGGLGLGLTLVRRLAEAHGGHVEVRSDGLGKGSEFLVTLPATEPGRRGGLNPLSGVRANDIGSRPLRVLVVDDDVDSASLTGEMLTLFGHEVHVVNDPVAALDTAAALDWDLILLDIGLPGMDGYEVTRRMRAGRAHRARIVAVSGFGGAPDRQRSLAAGCDEHLLKPVSVDDLRDVVARTAIRPLSS